MFVRRTITFSQEIVTGLAWLAFAFISTNVPLINTLEAEYPSIDDLFHLGFAAAGFFILLAIAKPDLFVPAWVFSCVVAISTLIASIGVEGVSNATLYPVTWALFVFLSLTQAIRHFWNDDCGT